MVHHVTYPRFVYAKTELGDAEAMQEEFDDLWEISYPWGHRRFFGTESQVKVEMRRAVMAEQNDGRVACVFSKGDTINYHWDTYKVTSAAGSVVKLVLLESRYDAHPFPDALDFPEHSCCLIVTRRWDNGTITCDYKDETLEEHEQGIVEEQRRRRWVGEARAEEESEDDGE